MVPQGLHDPYKGSYGPYTVWGLYLIGIRVRDVTWPQFYGSFGPEGLRIAIACWFYNLGVSSNSGFLFWAS